MIASFVVILTSSWRNCLLFAWEMESLKFEYCGVIKLKERCKATAIHQRFVAMYGDSAPNYCTVKRWFNEFASRTWPSVWKLLLKRGLKGRTDTGNSFSSHKQLTRKVAKMHWHRRRLHRKMTVWLKFCCYFVISKLQNFLIAPHYTLTHLPIKVIQGQIWRSQSNAHVHFPIG